MFLEYNLSFEGVFTPPGSDVTTLMHRFPFQSGLNYYSLLPATRGKWSTPVNSPHHTGQENVWFVGCSTTARATPASGESDRKFTVYFRQQ